MATKKITKATTYNYSVNSSNMNDDTFIIPEKLAKKGAAIDIDLSGIYGYKYYFVKSGNDLLIYSSIGNGYSVLGGVKTTIKDYYKLVKKYPWILGVKLTGGGDYKGYEDYIKDNAVDVTYFAGGKGDGLFGTKGSDTLNITSNKKVFDSAGNDTYYNSANNAGSGSYIYDYAGKDIYYMSNNSYTRIEDKGGNDSYNAYGSGTGFNVKDYAGNDNYVSQYAGGSIVEDFKGKDNYTIIENSLTATLTDHAGNDSYKIYHFNENVTVNDKKGNDKYDILYYKDSSKNVTINDDAGNDIYNVSFTAPVVINDKQGKDKYNIINAYYDINITDGEENSSKSGDDKYNIMHADEAVTIKDYAGKESYNITSADDVSITDAKGNDSYNIKNTHDTYITDKTGKDSYNISYNHYVMQISDGEYNTNISGNDKYNLSYISDFGGDALNSVTDYSGNEKYNLSYVDYLNIDDFAGVKDSRNTTIRDFGTAQKVGKKLDKKLANDKYSITNSIVTTEDTEGADTYTISSNSTVKITDKSTSNDTYKINGMNNQVKIDDKGGTKDKLTLSVINKNNLIFMVDYSSSASEGNDKVSSGALFIFDKSNRGYVKVENFFDVTSAGYIHYNQGAQQLKGDGYIETIKAGKSNLTNNIINFASMDNLESLAGDVASWFSSAYQQYSSVSDLLNNGDNIDIASFISTMSTALS